VQFDHIALKVDSIEDAVTWYCNNTKATVDYQDDTWSLLRVGDIKLALVLSDMHPAHFAFRVDDKNDLNEISEHRDGSLYNYVTDPWGNTMELIYYPEEKN